MWLIRFFMNDTRNRRTPNKPFFLSDRLCPTVRYCTGMEQDKLLLNKREVAHLLSLSPRTIDNLLRQNLLTARRIGRRTLVMRSSIEQFVRTDYQKFQSASKVRDSEEKADGGCS